MSEIIFFFPAIRSTTHLLRVTMISNSSLIIMKNLSGATGPLFCEIHIVRVRY